MRTGTAPPAWPRLGLCCQFRDQPIRFRDATAMALLKRSRAARLARLAALALANAEALMDALRFCAARGIGAFRFNSRILPLKTHPRAGYALDDLPGADAIRRAFEACGVFARAHGLRLSSHPDQFVVLNSPDAAIVRRAVAELAYHAEVSAWVGADTINLHGGGGYGDKSAALARLVRAIGRLPAAIRTRLTLENDDVVFTPADLLPVCRATGVPLVYDVHHHRCLPDGVDEAETTAQAGATWGGREPVMHLSSPRDGWGAAMPRRHHDFIAPSDFPRVWRGLAATVEVEAKAKEVAVLRLARWLRRQDR